MKLRHLKYFVAVAEELNFTRAAQRLNMAQPPLSQQIKQLEDGLDAVLIERGSRPLKLTRAGDVMLDHARKILAAIEAAEAEVMRTAKGQTGVLNVAFVGSSLYSILPGILATYRQQFPNVDVSLNEMLAPDIAAALRNQTADVGIVRPALTDCEELEHKSLIEEPMVLAVPEGHSIAHKNSVPLSVIENEPLILYPRHPKPSLTDDIGRFCDTISLELDIKQEVLHLQTALILVGQGVGLTFVAKSVAHQPRVGVAFVAIDHPAPKSGLTVAWKRGIVSPSLTSFLDICVEQSRLYQTEEVEVE